MLFPCNVGTTLKPTKNLPVSFSPKLKGYFHTHAAKIFTCHLLSLPLICMYSSLSSPVFIYLYKSKTRYKYKHKKWECQAKLDTCPRKIYNKNKRVRLFVRIATPHIAEQSTYQICIYQGREFYAECSYKKPGSRHGNCGKHLFGRSSVNSS